MAAPHLRLLSRRQCCLCDDAKVAIDALAAQGLCSWESVNVDQNKSLLVRYGMHVPVLLMGDDELFRHQVPEAALKSILVELKA